MGENNVEASPQYGSWMRAATRKNKWQWKSNSPNREKGGSLVPRRAGGSTSSNGESQPESSRREVSPTESLAPEMSRASRSRDLQTIEGNGAEGKSRKGGDRKVESVIMGRECGKKSISNSKLASILHANKEEDVILISNQMVMEVDQMVGGENDGPRMCDDSLGREKGVPKLVNEEEEMRDQSPMEIEVGEMKEDGGPFCFKATYKKVEGGWGGSPSKKHVARQPSPRM